MFGCLGGLLALIAGQAILPLVASKSIDDSPSFTDIDMVVGLIGFIGGLAIWYWLQSKSSNS